MTGVLLAAGLSALAVWLRGMPGRHQAGEPAVLGAATPYRWDVLAAWRSRRELRAAAAQLGELLSALAAELGAGQPTDAALRSALDPLHPALCPRARAAAHLGVGIPGALRADAMAAGMGELRALAACWEVAAHSGAGLAGAVSRLAETGRGTRRAREQLRAEVAAVQATARILAFLPVFGLVMGQWLGADSVGWLLGSWPGRLTALAGLTLQGLGLLWLARIVRSARASM